MQLLFTRSRSLPTVLIRWVTWSQWSHVGIITPQDTVIEARAFHGVVETPLAEAVQRASHSAVIGVTLPDEAAALAWAGAQLGKRYDWTGAIGIGLRREWDQPNAWWCSELAEGALAAGGRRAFRRGVARVTPEHSWMVER